MNFRKIFKICIKCININSHWKYSDVLNCFYPPRPTVICLSWRKLVQQRHMPVGSRLCFYFNINDSILKKETSFEIYVYENKLIKAHELTSFWNQNFLNSWSNFMSYMLPQKCSLATKQKLNKIIKNNV